MFFNRLILAISYRIGKKYPGSTYVVKCNTWKEAWRRSGNLLAEKK